jgi:hypothetical protein
MTFVLIYLLCLLVWAVGWYFTTPGPPKYTNIPKPNPRDPAVSDQQPRTKPPEAR